jgi:hypothetical protein
MMGRLLRLLLRMSHSSASREVSFYSECVDRIISTKEMDEGHRLTFATDIFVQSFTIRFRSCLTSSGRTRDLRGPMLPEIPRLT